MKTSYTLFAGYTTLAVPGPLPKPEFVAPSNYSASDKIAKYVEEAASKFESSKHEVPYYGTLGSLSVLLQARSAEKEQLLTLRWDNRQAVLHGKVPRGDLAKAFSLWLRENTEPQEPITVVCFGSRKFVKIAGIDAAIAGAPLPPEVWYNADHRDIGHAIAPDGFSALTQATAMAHWAALAAASEDAVDKWAAQRLKAIGTAWSPGHDDQLDLLVTVWLASKLGLFGAGHATMSRICAPWDVDAASTTAKTKAKKK